MGSNSNKKRSSILSRKFGSMFLNDRSITRDLVGSGIQDIYKTTKQKGWEVFLFGGVPRSTWISNGPVRVRDFDLVVSDECFDELSYTFSEYIVRKNRFGGIKLLIENIEFDAWKLSSTWAFRNGLVNPPKFEQLPETVFLNIDSIVIELAPPEGLCRRVYQSGFYTSIREKCLDIRLRENPFPELCALRALRMAQIMQFSLTRELAAYILDVVHEDNLKDLLKVQQHHYGRVIFDTQNLTNFSAVIEKKLAVANREKLDLFGNLIQNQFDF
ncbi:MAG: hypothetical protein EOP84_01990 [Verrucomicrobiaceae bacterium]|nr:MAG: hypothetical protein EOP84_01990 [Verrucomicrobiaceae bacterium]